MKSKSPKYTNMKTQVAFISVMILVFSSCIGRGPVDKSGEFKISKEKFSFVQTYPTSSNVNLYLSTAGGNIDVEGYKGDQIIVSFLVSKNGDVLEMTLEQLKKYANVEISHSGSNLDIRIDDIRRKNLSIGFKVKTPLKTMTVLNTSGGNIDISGMTGNQKINTSGGNLGIEDITGDISANTSGGNIDLEDLTGRLNVSTSGGNIDGSDLTGELHANTSGGNIDISGIQGNMDVSTSGGNIDLDGISGSAKAMTSGGNISARIKTITGKLELETSGGDIDCTLPNGLGLDLDLSADDIDTPLTNFKGSSQKEHITGQINGGGIPVRLSCPGGSIDLNYK